MIVIFCLGAFYSLMCFQIHHQITILAKEEILLPYEGLSADVNLYGLFLNFYNHVLLHFLDKGTRGKS